MKSNNYGNHSRFAPCDQLTPSSCGLDLKACHMQVFYETRLTNPAITNTEGKQNTNTLLFRSDNTVSSFDPPFSNINQLLASFLGIQGPNS